MNIRWWNEAKLTNDVNLLAGVPGLQQSGVDPAAALLSLRPIGHAVLERKAVRQTGVHPGGDRGNRRIGRGAGQHPFEPGHLLRVELVVAAVVE